MAITSDIRAVAEQFKIEGHFLSAVPITTGYINDTYTASFLCNRCTKLFTLQRINQKVFKDPTALMENIRLVTSHIRKKLETNDSVIVDCRVLTIVPTHDDKLLLPANGSHWRCYDFIEEVETSDQVTRPKQAYESARLFGLFQQQLIDLPPHLLHETIPGFHDSRKRLDNLYLTTELDLCNRAIESKNEIRFCLDRDSVVDVLQSAGFPSRAVHNDARLNNVLIHRASGKALCVIDLDTVMPGLSLHDFGDLCRTGCNPCTDDEQDLSKIKIRLDVFEELVQGYLVHASSFLSQAEIDHLVFSAKLIAFELGARFLTDYLQGDTYFKTSRVNHNLDRARAQFALVRSFEQHEQQTLKIVRENS